MCARACICVWFLTWALISVIGLSHRRGYRYSSLQVLIASYLITLITHYCHSPHFALQVFIGSYFGFKKEEIRHPVRVNNIPRQIPPQPWYLHPIPSVLVGGILPFGAVFIEIFFVLGALFSGACVRVCLCISSRKWTDTLSDFVSSPTASCIILLVIVHPLTSTPSSPAPSPPSLSLSHSRSPSHAGVLLLVHRGRHPRHHVRGDLYRDGILPAVLRGLQLVVEVIPDQRKLRNLPLRILHRVLQVSDDSSGMGVISQPHRHTHTHTHTFICIRALSPCVFLSHPICFSLTLCEVSLSSHMFLIPCVSLTSHYRDCSTKLEITALTSTLFYFGYMFMASWVSGQKTAWVAVGINISPPASRGYPLEWQYCINNVFTPVLFSALRACADVLIYSLPLFFCVPRCTAVLPADRQHRLRLMPGVRQQDLLRDQGGLRRGQKAGGRAGTHLGRGSPKLKLLPEGTPRDRRLSENYDNF